jgi:hypothetical protein
MGNYVKDDEKGRIIFDAFCKQETWCKVNKYAKNDYSKWDVSYYSGNTAMLGEIKKRKYESTAYGTWFLQEDKYIALTNTQTKLKQNGKDVKLTYINFFTDNITQVWELDKIDMTKLEKKNVLLQVNDYDDVKEWKMCYMLPHVYAHKYETDLSKSIFN